GAVGGSSPLTTLTASAGNFNAAQAISTSGAVSVTATSIGLKNLAAGGDVALNGATTLDGSYTTSNDAFAVTGTTTLAGDTTVSTGTGAISFGGTVDGAHALSTTNTGSTTFSGTVGASSPLTTLTASAGSFNAAQAIRTNGAVSVTATSIGLKNLTAGGDVALNGATTLDGSYTTSNDAFAVTGTTTLVGDTTVSTGSGSISFSDRVDGGRSLILDSAKATELSSLVGSSAALTMLDVTGPASLHGVQTSGSQHYGSAVLLTNTFGASAGTITFDGPVTLGGNVAVRANTVAVRAPIDGPHALMLDAATRITISGAVGATAAPTSLIASAVDRIDVAASSITTRGDQHWNGAVWLNSDARLVSQEAGSIVFNGAINSANGSSLTAETAGVTRFTRALGVEGALGRVATDYSGSAGDKTEFAFGTAGPSVRTTGDIVIRDAVVSDGPLTLNAGGSVMATNTANRWAAPGNALNIDANSAEVRSSNSLRIGDVHLRAGGDITADQVVTFGGDLVLDGGTLVVTSNATPTVLGHYSDPTLLARAAQAGVPTLRFGSADLQEYSATISQEAGSSINTAAGSLLALRSTVGGSINIEGTTNTLHGDVSAISGTYSDANRFSQTAKSIPVSFVRLSSDQINVAGSPRADLSAPASGLLADAIKITSTHLRTGTDGLIKARLPYIDAQGVPTSLPGVVFDILPAGLTSQGFGSPSQGDWIRIQIGDEGRGGFVTLNPKGAFRPDFAVFAGGSTSQIPFYDGTNVSTEIQIFYNGALPQSANLVGALTAVSAIAEDARRQKIEDAVRTENVTRRLRSGVIAEVGPGRPATTDVDGLRRPETCDPDANSLSCK
ncbi:beta strand repeat-containing protein, partial [Niveibacterium sp.]|uniref:beta strand repeat-containing protein n=1 Tax=Niveibacterium sp. TaxID=2017444 RepID=UPI0035B1B0D1